MRRPFSTLTALLLTAIAIAHALRLAYGWNVNIAGLEVPTSVSAVAIGLLLALALGLWFEARMHAAMASKAAALAAPETTRAAPSRSGGKAFTVHKGRRYRAAISLGLFEQVASNDTIAGMLEDAGFRDVTVTGSGARRTAEATWPKDDQTGPMPSQIVSADELPATDAVVLASAATRASPTRAGNRFTVRQGCRYRATISLGFFEQVASNDTIAGMFTDAGFCEVKVTGTGSRRTAEGLWPNADASADMPSQVVSAVEIAAPKPPAVTVASAKPDAPDPAQPSLAASLAAGTAAGPAPSPPSPPVSLPVNVPPPAAPPPAPGATVVASADDRGRSPPAPRPPLAPVPPSRRG